MEQQLTDFIIFNPDRAKHKWLAMSLGVMCGALLAIFILNLPKKVTQSYPSACHPLTGASYERACQYVKPIVKRLFPYQLKITHMSESQIEVMHKVEQVLGVEYAELIFRESGFHPTSVNHLGACGLGQALPCAKMGCALTDVDCQLNWVKNYVVRRYGTPSRALAFHDQKGWY